MSDQPDDQDLGAGTSRRTFLARSTIAGAVGAAVWIAPAVLTVDAAAAGSCAPLDMSLGTTTGANGWTLASSGMATTGGDLLGVSTSWYVAGRTQFVVERNPVTPVTSASVNYSKNVTLAGGKTYTFTFTTFNRNVNQYTQVMAVQIGPSPGTPVTQQSYTTQIGGTLGTGVNRLTPDSTSQTWNLTFVPPADGTYTFRYNFTFLTTGNNGVTNGAGDDIGVTAPTVTCA